MYADKITQQILNSFEVYFNTLQQTGYIKYDVVFGLLGLILIDTFLNTDFNYYITEEDYKIILSFLHCIYGNNCLIQYPVFYKEIPQIGNILPKTSELNSYRNTQNNSLRISEKDNIMRITEYSSNF